MTVAAEAGSGAGLAELALHVLDLARNSIEAGASRVSVAIDEAAGAGSLTLTVADDGRGMDRDRLARVCAPDAGSRASRAGAPGLVRLCAAAGAAAGRVAICSTPGTGTRVDAVFGDPPPARPPLGNLEDTAVVLMAAHPGVILDWTHRRGARQYSLSTADVLAALDGAPLASAAGVALLRAAVRHGEQSLDVAAPRPAGTEDQP